MLKLSLDFALDFMQTPVLIDESERLTRSENPEADTIPGG
jgi:hypothetical protein